MARRRPPTVHGLAVIDKPAGMTSHDVVAICRRQLGERRVGHAGTLDPDATGVLLAGVGHVTRLLRFLTALGKSYTAEVVLGVETSTLDSSGEVTATHQMSPPTIEAGRAAAATLTGPIMQVPPMVSALKVGGRRLHALAREGIEVDRPARPVTVHSFDVEQTADPMVLAIAVSCSSGTYVRSLAADLGHLLGGGAHLRNLCRTSVGSFTRAEAHPPDAPQLLTPVEALRDYPQVELDAPAAALVGNGRALPRAEQFAGEGPWALTFDGDLRAMYAADGEMVRPVVVMPDSVGR